MGSRKPAPNAGGYLVDLKLAPTAAALRRFLLQDSVRSRRLKMPAPLRAGCSTSVNFLHRAIAETTSEKLNLPHFAPLH